MLNVESKQLSTFICGLGFSMIFTDLQFCLIQCSQEEMSMRISYFTTDYQTVMIIAIQLGILFLKQFDLTVWLPNTDKRISEIE